MLKYNHKITGKQQFWPSYSYLWFTELRDTKFVTSHDYNERVFRGFSVQQQVERCLVRLQWVLRTEFPIYYLTTLLGGYAQQRHYVQLFIKQFLIRRLWSIRDLQITDRRLYMNSGINCQYYTTTINEFNEPNIYVFIRNIQTLVSMVPVIGPALVFGKKFFWLNIHDPEDSFYRIQTAFAASSIDHGYSIRWHAIATPSLYQVNSRLSNYIYVPTEGVIGVVHFGYGFQTHVHEFLAAYGGTLLRVGFANLDLELGVADKALYTLYDDAYPQTLAFYSNFLAHFFQSVRGSWLLRGNQTDDMPQSNFAETGLYFYDFIVKTFYLAGDKRMSTFVQFLWDEYSRVTKIVYNLQQHISVPLYTCYIPSLNFLMSAAIHVSPKELNYSCVLPLKIFKLKILNPVDSISSVGSSFLMTLTTYLTAFANESILQLSSNDDLDRDRRRFYLFAYRATLAWTLFIQWLVERQVLYYLEGEGFQRAHRVLIRFFYRYNAQRRSFFGAGRRTFYYARVLWAGLRFYLFIHYTALLRGMYRTGLRQFNINITYRMLGNVWLYSQRIFAFPATEEATLGFKNRRLLVGRCSSVVNLLRFRTKAIIMDFRKLEMLVTRRYRVVRRSFLYGLKLFRRCGHYEGSGRYFWRWLPYVQHKRRLEKVAFWRRYNRFYRAKLMQFRYKNQWIGAIGRLARAYVGSHITTRSFTRQKQDLTQRLKYASSQKVRTYQKNRRKRFKNKESRIWKLRKQFRVRVKRFAKYYRIRFVSEYINRAYKAIGHEIYFYQRKSRHTGRVILSVPTRMSRTFRIQRSGLPFLIRRGTASAIFFNLRHQPGYVLPGLVRLRKKRSLFISIYYIDRFVRQLQIVRSEKRHRIHGHCYGILRRLKKIYDVYGRLGFVSCVFTQSHVGLGRFRKENQQVQFNRTLFKTLSFLLWSLVIAKRYRIRLFLRKLQGREALRTNRVRRWLHFRNQRSIPWLARFIRPRDYPQRKDRIHLLWPRRVLQMTSKQKWPYLFKLIKLPQVSRICRAVTYILNDFTPCGTRGVPSRAEIVSKRYGGGRFYTFYDVQHHRGVARLKVLSPRIYEIFKHIYELSATAFRGPQQWAREDIYGVTLLHKSVIKQRRGRRDSMAAMLERTYQSLIRPPRKFPRRRRS